MVPPNKSNHGTTKHRVPIHRYIQCGLGYSFYFGANALFLLLLPPVLLLTLPVPSLRARLIRFFFTSYVVTLTRDVLPFLRVYEFKEVSGRDHTSAQPAPIFVANHRSRIDGPMLLALLPPVATIMKSSYARLPVFSSFVKHLQFVSVDSKNVRMIAEAIDRCRSILDSDRGILIFPEGTRARTGRLLPFRELAFKLAKESGHPIVPVIVHSDDSFMAKRPGSIFPRHKLQFTVRFLEPHSAGDHETVSDFSHRVHRRMARELAQLDKGTPWEK